MTWCKQILLHLFIILIVSSCSRYGRQTSAKIIISGLISELQNDIVLNGVSSDGDYFSTHLKGSQAPDAIEIPTNTWNFYGFYWENQKAYCTWKTKELIGASEQVNLIFSQENCFHPKFVHPAYKAFNETEKNPLIAIPCDLYNEETKNLSFSTVEDINKNCKEFDYKSVQAIFSK